ncbi:lysostaphin resistance A-like protein [Micromonospora sp. NPDC050495]|uniref:lysostaphin resistance A-like protein n=1 Tax=Micromonospora sp. NPDC050495 TaxID=3154936 RepID=UPI0033FE0982
MDTGIATRRSPFTFILLLVALSIPFLVVGAIVESPRWMPMGMPVSAFMIFCPLIAASLLIHRQEGRAGVWRLVKRSIDVTKVRPRIWYLPAVLLMPAVLLLSYVVMRLTGAPLPEQPYVSLAAIPVLFLVFTIAAALEEAGWMGYAAEPLQARWNALTTGVVLGVVWAAWHVTPWAYVHDARWVAGQCLSTVAGRVLIVWLFNNTGGAVYAAVMFHAMMNLSEALFPNDSSHYDPLVTGIILAAVTVAVVLLWGPETLTRARRSHAQAVQAAP